MISGTIREFTAQNVMRAMALNGNAIVSKRGKLSAEAAAGAVSLSIVADTVPGDSSTAIAGSAGAIPAGATLVIQRPDGETDYVFPTRSSGASTFSGGTHTVAIAGDFDIPAGMSFPVGSKVWILNEIQVGGDQNDLFAVKITGTLSNFDKPVVFVAPKVSVMRGFNLSFTETEYGGMPWEMRPLLLSASEATGRLAEIGTKAPGRVYIA
jgi:hypothetical protein